MASGSTMVEQSTALPEVESSNPACTRYKVYLPLPLVGKRIKN
jgi:hypothetical protein